MNDFAWFNHNGVWFRVHGDPGTDEARELMRMAISDLSLSKAQNVNNLEIVDVNRFPFYQVKSHFGKDTINLWPERFAEEKRGKFQRIERTPRGEKKAYYAFAYEVCDRDFIDGGADSSYTGDIPVPVGYAICQPGTLRGWELLETDNVIPMHFMSNYNDDSNNPGDWANWVSSYRNNNPACTVYPFMYPDWKLQTQYPPRDNPVTNVDGYNPYPSDEIVNGVIRDKLVAIVSDGETVKYVYDVSQPPDMCEAVFHHWQGVFMTTPGRAVTNYPNYILGYDGYLLVDEDWPITDHWSGRPIVKFGPQFVDGTTFSIDIGNCCAKDLNKYVQFHHISHHYVGDGTTRDKEWLHIGNKRVKIYRDSIQSNYGVHGWVYRWFEMSEHSAIIPFIRLEGDLYGTPLSVICELWQYTDEEATILDEITFNTVGLAGQSYSYWHDSWFELTGDNGEALRLSSGNTARCWGAFRMFKIIEEIEYKDKIEITEGEI